jgi:catechol 2,3-dioxygenase-like lactoylglutathione lyase family enzyme
MQLADAYPVYITRDLAGSVAFYTSVLGFTPVFESSWFVYLRSAGEPPRALAFMDESHPSTPPSPRAFDGSGGFLTLEVADVDAAYAAAIAAGARAELRPRDEPWGQRRFGLVDPNGMWVDLVQQIEPAPGFWAPYLPSAATAA